MKNAQEQKEEIYKIWSVLKKEETPANDQDLRIIDQIASYFSINNYYYYILSFAELKMKYVHPNIKNILGIEPLDFTTEKYLDSLHPDHLELFKLKEQCVGEFFFNFLDPKDILKYKVSYTLRMKNAQGTYFQNLHQSTAISTTDKGIGSVICTETDISHLANTLDYYISFIDLEGNDSYLNLDIRDFKIEKSNEGEKLSEKEIHVLKHISYGLNNEEIGKEMFISPLTVKTHKRNIMKKTEMKSIHQVVAEYVKKGII